MNQRYRKCSVLRVALLLGCCALAVAQTKVDLGSQGQNVDFSSATSTRPFRTGAALPAICSTGEIYFKTNEPAGLNVYGCTSTNLWTLLASGGGGAGAIMAGDLRDCKVTVDGPVATLKAPCKFSVGGTVSGITTDATATLSGDTASGTVYFYWDSTGRLTADENTAATLNCNSNCSTAATGGFPSNSFPIATATFTSLSYDGGGVTDKRAWLNQKIIVAGAGITANVDGGTGVQTVSTDPLEVPRFNTGTANPPTQNCTAGRDFYANPAVNKEWGCTAANSWTELTAPIGLADPGSSGFLDRTALNVTAARTLTGTASEIAVANGGGGGNPTISIADTFRITGKTATAPMKVGTSLPATCTVGDFYYKSDATAGQNTYGCTATNTWTLQGGAGLADPGSSGFLDRTALNVTAARTLTGTAGEIAVANGGGGGNPTLSIADTFRITGKTATAPMKVGTSLPATCTVGDFYYKSDATAGQNTYGCTATNTWTLQGGAGTSLPDQTNARGMYLTTDGSTAAWARSIDKGRVQSRVVENFLSQTYGRLGELGWAAAGTGYLDYTSLFAHPGMRATYTDGSANSMGALALSGAPHLGALGSNGKWTSFFTFRTGTYDDQNQIAYRVGFSDGTGNSPANGIWLRFWKSTGCTNNGSDSFWTYETRSGGTASTFVTSVSPALEQWIVVRIRSLVAGTILFSLSTDDGGSWTTEQSMNTNVPTANLYPMFQVVTCSTGMSKLWADDWSYEVWR